MQYPPNFNPQTPPQQKADYPSTPSLGTVIGSLGFSLGLLKTYFPRGLAWLLLRHIRGQGGECCGSSVANWDENCLLATRGDRAQETLPRDTPILPDNRPYQESPPYKGTTTRTDSVLPVDPVLALKLTNAVSLVKGGGGSRPRWPTCPQNRRGYAATTIHLRSSTAMGEETAAYGESRLGIGWRDHA
ncbi:hypothetical protein PG991_000764 [Apiospora marii]|uniref:Uncharacterized protein n=1 Tax=Apiospora marii TaxID=335849 RepID=A0ABR1SSX1_9PEZI